MDGRLRLAQPWALALRNLLQDKLRFALSVTGVALAVMLILFLLGLRQGIFRSAVMYLDHAPGSVVVLPRGVRSTGAGSGQFVAPETVEAITATPGAARATPVLLMMAIPDLHGKKVIIKLVGYDPQQGGGPWDLKEGREPEADDEVVLDSVLADRHGFDLGQTFEVSGLELKVVGLSGQTSSWTGSYVFARKSFVERLELSPGVASFVLVTPASGVSRADLMARLQSIEGTNVLLKSDVMRNDQQIVAGIADQVVILMVAAAFVVGALVVAMVTYTATLERRAEYGIVKALGAGNGVLYRVVAAQAIVAASVGAGLGVGFAYAMGWFVMNAKPQFLVAIGPQSIAMTLAAGIVMALVGALFPARALTGVAPAEVFRR